MIHTIQLSPERVYRSKSEYRTVTRASCGEIDYVSDHNAIIGCCKKMLDLGMTGDVEVWRGQTLVFPPYSLEKWAANRLGVNEQPVQFRET